jgi:hypothetical protein
MWHVLQHILPLEELATSGLKHKIDYTVSHSTAKRTKTWMDMKGFLPKSRGT